jgi:hypothetical protein
MIEDIMQMKLKGNTLLRKFIFKLKNTKTAGVTSECSSKSQKALCRPYFHLHTFFLQHNPWLLSQ